MKAIQVTCPNCGAQLRVSETSALVMCEYCNKQSAIQRRTRILERVLPPPTQVDPALRFAVQKHTRTWVITLLATIIVPMIIVGVIIFTVVRKAQREFKDGMAMPTSSQVKKHQQAVPPAKRPPSWQGTDNVLVADVDGDGTPELIGRGRQVNAGDIIMLLALDLATGKTKWTSEPLGTYNETYRGPLAVGGDLILFGDDKGAIQTFGLADGKRRWRAQLDERSEQFCAGDDKTVIAVGKDDVLRPLSRADGTPAGPTKNAPGKGRSVWDKPDPCTLLPGDDTTAFERHKAQSRRAHGTRFGIDIDAELPLPGGGKLLSGARAEGTRVTTLVAVDAKGKETWRATAAADALSAESAPRYVVVGEREVCIQYYGREYRMGCFALADGKRLWDSAAPAFFEGLTVIGRTLVMTTHRDLQVLDLDTGAVRWTRE